MRRYDIISLIYLSEKSYKLKESIKMSFPPLLGILGGLFLIVVIIYGLISFANEMPLYVILIFIGGIAYLIWLVIKSFKEMK